MPKINKGLVRACIVQCEEQLAGAERIKKELGILQDTLHYADSDEIPEYIRKEARFRELFEDGA